jgi:hypothetical protein
VERLLSSIEGADRGLGNSAEQREAVLAAAAELAELGRGATTTGSDLSATWKLLWTTEKVRRALSASSGGTLCQQQLGLVHTPVSRDHVGQHCCRC